MNIREITNNIAVYVNNYGELVSFSDTNSILLFEKHEGVWDLTSELIVSFDRVAGLNSLRKQLAAVIDEMKGCDIIAGLSMTGFAYNEFDRRGFHIFDIEDCNTGIFNKIVTDIEENERKKAGEESAKALTPVETDTPGVYFMNLITLQAEHPEISSKQALRGFLENTPMLELRIICGHIPLWLENSDYDIISAPYEGGNCLAIVRKKSVSKPA